MTFSLLKILVGMGVVAVVSSALFYLVFSAILRSTISIKPALAKNWRDRVLMRYQKLSTGAGGFAVAGTSAWMFAWFKLLFDPMFDELPAFFGKSENLRTALDIGCGYGITGCVLLEWFPDLKLFGIDPNETRVRAAGAVFGSRGQALQGLAPDFERPELPDRVDMVMALDVIHFMTASEQELTLSRIRGRLNNDGHLFIRALIPPTNAGSRAWKFARIWRLIFGGRAGERSVEQIRGMIERADFEIEKTEMSGGNQEMFWFIARAGRNGGAEKVQAPIESEGVQ